MEKDGAKARRTLSDCKRAPETNQVIMMKSLINRGLRILLTHRKSDRATADVFLVGMCGR
jgi:hypothetical protein